MSTDKQRLAKFTLQQAYLERLLRAELGPRNFMGAPPDFRFRFKLVDDELVTTVFMTEGTGGLAGYALGPHVPTPPPVPPPGMTQKEIDELYASVADLDEDEDEDEDEAAAVAAFKAHLSGVPADRRAPDDVLEDIAHKLLRRTKGDAVEHGPECSCERCVKAREMPAGF